MLHHAALEIRRVDLEAEVRFWSLLGFERVDPPSGLIERAAWMQRAGTQIHLFFAQEPVIPPDGHTAVVADDFEATFEALREAGAAPEHHTRHWGAARAFTRSPSGHLVEFMAAAP
jgi:catechol 2,3-dioxygenase-like lactoylglutathione lyase family enzyme